MGSRSDRYGRNDRQQRRNEFLGQGSPPSTLFVEDLEAAKAFYGKTFGMPVMWEDPNSAVFEFGSTLINLLRITEAPVLVEPAKGGDARVRITRRVSPSRSTT